MKAFKVFIFGLLYGWFLKIAFDRIYRDNEIDDVRNENAALREYIRSMEKKFRSAPPERQPAISTVAAAPPTWKETGKDDLKVIKGIGPAIEKKLNAAGVQTFEALARITQEELENILGERTKRLAREGDLIGQAEKLAREK